MVTLMLSIGITLNYCCKPVFHCITESTSERTSNSRIKWQRKNICPGFFGNKSRVINAAIIDDNARKTNLVNSFNYLSNGRRFVVRRHNDKNFTVLNHEGRLILFVESQNSHLTFEAEIVNQKC